MKGWVIKRFGTIGSRFNHLQHWVAYTAAEGERIQMLGCNTEEDAERIVKRFRDTGLMKNPLPFADHGTESPDYIEPVMVAKMHTRVIYQRVPVAK